MIPHFRPSIDDGDIDAVVQTLRGKHLSDGVAVEALERALSARFDDAEVVAVSSGTAALYLALAALGVARGSTVVIPSYTCASLYAAVAHIGAAPVCADSHHRGICITPATVAAVNGTGTGSAAAVIAPYCCGFACDVAGMRSAGRFVIEDCAHTFWGMPGAGLLGLSGDVAVLSFFATKLAPAGEGGACVTRERALAERIRAWRNCDERPLHPHAFNFKMTDLCAALARRRVEQMESEMAERAALADEYDRAFTGAAVRLAAEQPQVVPFRYLVDAPGAVDAFIAAAAAAGITCRRPVFKPLHCALGGDCPRAAQLHDRIVSVPMYPGLSKAERRHILERLPPLLK